MNKFWKITMRIGCIFCFIFTAYTVVSTYNQQPKPKATIGYITVCVSGLTFLQSEITGDLTQVFINNNNTLNCSMG